MVRRLTAPLRSLLLALGACALLAAGGGAASAVEGPGGGPTLRWLVAPADDLDGWRTAIAATWPDGGLVAEVWDGAWPPAEAAVAGPHAFVDGALAAGTLRVRDSVGGERRVPVQLVQTAPVEARRAVLLVVRGLWAPLAVADGGWDPVAAGESIELPPLVDLEPAAPAAEAPAPASGHLGIGLGGSGRSGLDGPTLAASVRLALALPTRPSVGVRLFVDVSGDLLGSAEVGGRPLQISGLAAVVGAEVRPGGARVQLPVWAAVGLRAVWGRLDEPLGGGPATGTTGTLRAGAAALGALSPEVHIGGGLVVGVDLASSDPPIELRVHDGRAWHSHELGVVTLGGQLLIELGRRPSARPR